MNEPLRNLRGVGQSIWYDNIRRALLESGRLGEYVNEYGVTGVTSNPSIFERAIAGSADYDAALREAIERGETDAEELFWNLAVADVRDAADVLRDVYERSDGADGFVSLELPPRLSHDTDGSVAFGTRLFARLERPNVMIKVPGTPEGVLATEELIYRGVNVNVTLLFSLSQWNAVAEAWLQGLERRAVDDRDLRVASVASFFISRIDSEVNDKLPPALSNRLGLANAGVAYAEYRRLLESERWRRLAEAGALPQRLLWASTSTKDPSLPDTYYVTALAAEGTVNTMPESTMLAYARSGVLAGVLSADGHDARRDLADAAVHGVDMEVVGLKLQRDGDKQFADAFDRMLGCIRVKKALLERGRRIGRVTLADLRRVTRVASTEHDHALAARSS